MKKYLFVALAAAALAGCSNDEWVDNGTPQDGEDKVPILMSAGLNVSVDTKAAVTGDAFANGQAESNLFNMVAFTGADPSNSNAYEWDGSSGSTPVLPVDATVEGSTQIFHLNPAQYYPSDDDTKLYFFAYAPVATGWDYKNTGTPTATITITGQEDIMWANATNSGSGYTKANSASNRPNFAFTHKLRKFDFYIMAANGVDPAGAKVESVTIGGQITSASLNVTNGTLTFTGSNDKTLALTSGTGVDIATYSASGDGNLVGSIMCQPTTGSNNNIAITVKLKDSNAELKGTLDLTSIATSDDAGKQYKVKLEYTLTEILATASITPWTDANNGAAITVPVQ